MKSLSIWYKQWIKDTIKYNFHQNFHSLVLLSELTKHQHWLILVLIWGELVKYLPFYIVDMCAGQVWNRIGRLSHELLENVLHPLIPFLKSRAWVAKSHWSATQRCWGKSESSIIIELRFIPWLTVTDGLFLAVIQKLIIEKLGK